MSKKRSVKPIYLLLIAISLTIVISGFVLAQQSSGSIVSDLTSMFQGFRDVFGPLAGLILGDVPNGELLFAKVLIAVILFSMIFIALGRIDIFSENLWAHWVIGLAVTVLSVRFLITPEIVQTIILPYSAFGIAVSSAFPFVLYFLLVNVGLEGIRFKTIRKVAWLFFAAIFVGLWFTRTKEIGRIGWIYPATALLALIVAGMDGSIQRFFHKMTRDRAIDETISSQVDTVKRQMAQATRDYGRKTIDEKRYKQLMFRYNRQLRILEQQAARI